MRHGTAGKFPPQKSRSYFKLLLVIAFAVGILISYTFMSSSRTSEVQRSSRHTSIIHARKDLENSLEAKIYKDQLEGGNGNGLEGKQKDGSVIITNAAPRAGQEDKSATKTEAKAVKLNGKDLILHSPPMEHSPPPPVEVSSGIAAQTASLAHAKGHLQEAADDLKKNGAKKVVTEETGDAGGAKTVVKEETGNAGRAKKVVQGETGAAGDKAGDAGGAKTAAKEEAGDAGGAKKGVQAEAVAAGGVAVDKAGGGGDAGGAKTVAKEETVNAGGAKKGVQAEAGAAGVVAGEKAGGGGDDSDQGYDQEEDNNRVDNGEYEPQDLNKTQLKKRPVETIARTAAFDALAYSKASKHPEDTIHVLFTSNGSPYQNFQARIMFATWKLAVKKPGGEKMVAMTRILHRTKPDELMEEIDTFRADPLQPECDTWCWFPVADRANAVQQWMDAVAVDHTMVKAPWLLMLETDYVWIKPLLTLGSAYDLSVPGLSFSFGYISTGHPIVLKLLKERCPDCDPNTVPDSGPAPVLARYSDFRANTPIWEELSLWIETHEDAKKALGWVREMYAWDIGVAVNKLNIRNEGSPKTTLISQPPHDEERFNATMYHYTWGSLYQDKEKKDIWKFDKRFYTAPEAALKVPELPMPPTWYEGLRLLEGGKVSQALHNTLIEMVGTMNEGIKTLPDLTVKT